MSAEVLVTKLDQIPPGEGRTFVIEAGPIAVFHTHEGTVHATQAYCPHLGGPLADGLIGSGSVMCPLHDRTFDLATGCGLTHERANLAVFATRLDERGNIFVAAQEVPERVPVRTGAAAHLHAAEESMEVVGSS